MFRFIWNNTPNNTKKVTEKVKREYLCKSKEAGGLGMINLLNMQDSFYLHWAIKLLSDSEYSWKTIPINNFKPVGGLSVFQSSVDMKSFKGEKLIDSSFWKKVLFSWLKHKNEPSIPSVCSINDPIFNNTLVRFKNRPLFLDRCINCSMIFIKDFMINGEIMNFQNFIDRFGNHADTIFAYNIIFNALKKIEIVLRNSYRQENFEGSGPQYFFKGIEAGDISRKTLYKLITNDEILSVNIHLREKFDIEESHADIWLVPFNCKVEIKLIILHWKILNNIFPSGTLLYKMKLKEDENCEVCGERDDLFHYFISCRIAKEVWKVAEHYIFKLTGQSLKLDEKTIMIGIYSCNLTPGKLFTDIVNKICLIGKFTISKFRTNKTCNISILFERELSKRIKINA